MGATLLRLYSISLIKPSQKDELRIMKSLRGEPRSIMFLGFNSLLLQQAAGN
jgi:hypothetical protein